MGQALKMKQGAVTLFSKDLSKQNFDEILEYEKLIIEK